MLLTSNVSPQACSSAKPRWHRGKLVTASLIVVLACSSGCTLVHNAHKLCTQNDSWNEAVLVMRNRSWATKAWHKRKHNFCNQKYSSDFAAGFRQGYEDVANGSNGCTPATPPRNYWTWEFQSGEGQSRTAAWFSGYPQGARAAEEDGVGNFAQIQLSSSLQSEYQQAGMLPKGAQVYPIQADPIQSNPTVVPNNVPLNKPAIPVKPTSPVPMPMGEPTIVPLPTSGL